MAHNILTSSQLNRFYDSRRQLDQAIGEILGPDVHLHDISEESQKSLDFSNSFAKRNSNFTPSNQNINRKNTDPFSSFFTSVNNQNKMQKLYKQNIELQKKIMTIKQQNQNYKHKAFLWEKTKKYILNSIDSEFKLKSIKFGSSDAAILDEFLMTLQELVAKYRQNFRIEKIDGGKDHVLCRELLDDYKKKYEDQAKEVSKLSIEIQHLKKENKILKEKDTCSRNQKELRFENILEDINEKTQTIDKNLLEKIEENKELRRVILSLQAQVKQLKSVANSLKKKDKSVSTLPDSLRLDESQIDLLRKISKAKDQQINSLRRQNKVYQQQANKLKTKGQKMKNVIKLAQSLNNEFLGKIQASMRMGKKEKEKVYHKALNQLAMQQYSLGNSYKNEEIENNFHLVNKRFKIVKSRSLQKQRFQYGQNKK